jgi:hypothetical protein
MPFFEVLKMSGLGGKGVGRRISGYPANWLNGETDQSHLLSPYYYVLQFALSVHSRMVG